MSDAIILAKELKQAWYELYADVKKNKRIKFELFESTFSQTYALLSNHVNEATVDKKYIELIAQAYLFANIKDETLDSTCLAALVLTERMLAYCAFDNSSIIDPTAIYIAEVRRDVIIDFNDIDESVSKLAAVFDSIFWKKIQQ